jgi:peptidoglycan hydrolase-like protein with peptidoglycan-binding domain
MKIAPVITRRRLVALAAVMTIAVGATIVSTTTRGRADATIGTSPDAIGSTGPGAESNSSSSSQRTARVARRDLERTFNVDGSLGYTGHRTIVGGEGVITALPELGTVFEAGQSLYGIDGHDGPIVLHGTLPMWRTVESSIDDGTDIEQVEGNLAYMGFAADGLVIDKHFSWATAQTIKNFQKAHGLRQTGALGPNDVWFTLEPVRVARVDKELGQSANGVVMTVTSVTQAVTVDLDAGQVRFVTETSPVTLQLPDGTTTAATITDIADTATVTPGSDGSATTTTIQVTITPSAALTIVDGSAVIVKLVTSAARDVLAVPVDAIVATADRRFAVEVVTGDATSLVEVTLGADADGWVEISGDITEGTTVVAA